MSWFDPLESVSMPIFPLPVSEKLEKTQSIDWMGFPARQLPVLVVLSPLGPLAGKDFVAFAIQDAHADCLRRPFDVRGHDDRPGRVRRFNLFLRQVRRTAIDRPANKLDPERPRLIRERAGRFADGTEPRRSAGDDQSNPTPISRCPAVIGLTFPAAGFRISLSAKLGHERASDGVYSLHPFQLPKQPCKHVRALCCDAGAVTRCAS